MPSESGGMAFRYDAVVPWGRSYDEYLRMFALEVEDLDRRLLGCADGPASFNCELARHGRRAISVDPLYARSASEIERRIDETFEDVIGQTRQERHRFRWQEIASIEELGQLRLAAMRAFLDDYEQGRRDGRYLAAELPQLPFRDGAFDLGLCSHLLFFYAEQLSSEFHLAGLRELCRVAREIRIFPLVDVNGCPSPHVDPARRELDRLGWTSEIQPVPYEFQRGGNEMLLARSRRARDRRP